MPTQICTNARRLTLVFSLLSLSMVTPAASVSAEPASPTEASAAPEYRSAFAEYRPQQQIELRPWREVNDEMGSVGGHAGHIKESAPAAGVQPTEEKR